MASNLREPPVSASSNARTGPLVKLPKTSGALKLAVPTSPRSDPAMSGPGVRVAQASPAKHRNMAGPAQRTLRHQIPWAGQAECKVLMIEGPETMTTLDVYRSLSHIGNIVYLEIVGSYRQGCRDARVTFQPPPQSSQWFHGGLDFVDTTTGRVRKATFKMRDNFPNYSKRVLEGPPSEIRLPAMHLGFGVMQTPEVMLKLHDVQSGSGSEVALHVSMQRKCLDVSFYLPIANCASNMKYKSYRMRLGFAQMTQVCEIQNTTTGQRALIISMEAPPQMFRKTDDVEATHEPNVLTWNEWQTWYRQSEIESRPENARRAITQLQRHSPTIDIGRWTTYALVFNRSTVASKAYTDLCSAFQHHNVMIKEDQAVQMIQSSKTNLWKWLDSPGLVLANETPSSAVHQLAEDVSHLSFELRYQLEVCVSFGIIHECNIDRDFLAKLEQLDSKRAVKLLEKAADEKQRFWDPNDIFTKLLGKISVLYKKVSTYNVIVRAAIVTPTTIYFATPALETSNRIVRQFSQYADYFLRVKFTDEKFKGKIMSYGDATMNELFTRIKRTMDYGIKVGDRHFEFLAAGNSQFREGGAWFFASTSGITAQTIRDWMGDFSEIKEVARYCARVGQCFSTTRSLQIGEVTVEQIPDVQRGKHNFTDGVGRISPFLAQMIATQYGLPNPVTDYPSVFQFRLGGSKGVLAVDPRLKKKTVQIRPSQLKFESVNHNDLNICRLSQFTTANLNVQIILVLSALGVDDHVFLRKMRDQLTELEEAMRSSDKAVELLTSTIDFNQMTIQLAQNICNGFMETKDPFTISCLRLWRSWTVKYLKEKARIPIGQGAFVLGCVDETGTLKGHLVESEGMMGQDVSLLPEVFLQVPVPHRPGQWHIIEGVIALARNPSLHPGDVRVVRAVNAPELHHFRDCVVMPQMGDRDLPSMCSGGDLDGDDYLAMWDEDLIPTEWYHPPMNYDAPPPKLATGPVTVNDMASFFVTHLKNNNLARIAVAHKYWADRLPDGVKDEKCLRLAQLHSRAVDYAKTGVPAEMGKDLRVREWPHWSGRKDKIYRSHKVIGKLYDMVDRVEFVPAWDMPFDERILRAYEIPDDTLQAASEIKVEYDAAVRRIMARYGIKSDLEVATTFVLDHHDDVGDYKFAEMLGEVLGTLQADFQKACYERAGTDDRVRDWHKMGPFIAAMYTVTAREVEAAVEECKRQVLRGGQWYPARLMAIDNMPFISFPWLFAAELGRIAAPKKSEVRTRLPTPAPVLPTAQKRLAAPSMTTENMPPPLPEITLSGSAPRNLSPQRLMRLSPLQQPRNAVETVIDDMDLLIAHETTRTFFGIDAVGDTETPSAGRSIAQPGSLSPVRSSVAATEPAQDQPKPSENDEKVEQMVLRPSVRPTNQDQPQQPQDMEGQDGPNEDGEEEEMEEVVLGTTIDESALCQLAQMIGGL